MIYSLIMIRVNVHGVKADLARSLAKLLDGDTITVGHCHVAPNCLVQSPDEELSAFEGSRRGSSSIRARFRG